MACFRPAQRAIFGITATSSAHGGQGSRRWSRYRVTIVTMPGRRPLTHDEETALLRVARGLDSRDRLLITTQWLTGLRLSETLRLTVGLVVRDGEIREMLGLAPRRMKGGRGPTRWIPILPELRRALECHLAHLGRRFELAADVPLFISRNSGPGGTFRPLGREAARRLLARAFADAGIDDDGRLGSHSLRKTWSKRVYANCGNDIMVLRLALGHRDVSTTQRYLEPDEEVMLAAVRGVDFTRRPRRQEPTTTHPANALNVAA
jgi:integrase/recombinase XerD